MFQVFDYVAEGKADAVVNGSSGTPSADAPKRTLVTATPRLVVFFRSNGELMNHPFSTWLLASKHLRRLTLSAATLQPEQAGVPASGLARLNTVLLVVAFHIDGRPNDWHPPLPVARPDGTELWFVRA